MKIVVLDTASLGEDVDLSPIVNLGETTIYEYVTPEQLPEIVSDAEVIVYNKSKLTAQVLEHAKKLKLACVTATGFDTVDTKYCREHGIAHDEVVYVGDDYGPGGNDESVYLSDFAYLTIDDYTTFPQVVADLLR